MNSKVLYLFIILLVIALGAWFWWNSLGAPASQEELQESNSQMLGDEPEYEVTSSEVEYFDGVTGYYARPLETGNYPGVVMIHEWWGLNDNIRDMARKLAGEGYAVLAVDLYGGEVAETSEQARELVGALDQEVATENLRAAATYLREENAPRIASLGWCFGGGQSLQLALSGEELDATVIYYGSLATSTEELSPISWPVLGIFGAEDQSIPVAVVNEFGTVLNEIGVKNEIYIYPGVGHAFANPSGSGYAPEETADAWERTLSFLEQALNPGL